MARQAQRAELSVVSRVVHLDDFNKNRSNTSTFMRLPLERDSFLQADEAEGEEDVSL